MREKERARVMREERGMREEGGALEWREKKDE